MEDSLKASGSLYHTEKVSSGKECLKKLQKEKFDILIYAGQMAQVISS